MLYSLTLIAESSTCRSATVKDIPITPLRTWDRLNPEPYTSRVMPDLKINALIRLIVLLLMKHPWTGSAACLS